MNSDEGGGGRGGERGPSLSFFILITNLQTQKREKGEGSPGSHRNHTKKRKEKARRLLCSQETTRRQTGFPSFRLYISLLSPSSSLLYSSWAAKDASSLPRMLTHFLLLPVLPLLLLLVVVVAAAAIVLPSIHPSLPRKASRAP